LIESLEAEVDADEEAAWSTEIRRRVEDSTRGGLRPFLGPRPADAFD
jgi:hypothetical protein